MIRPAFKISKSTGEVSVERYARMYVKSVTILPWIKKAITLSDKINGPVFLQWTPKTFPTVKVQLTIFRNTCEFKAGNDAYTEFYRQVKEQGFEVPDFLIIMQ